MQQLRIHVYPVCTEKDRSHVGTTDRANLFVEQMLRKVGVWPGEIVATDGKVDARSKRHRPATSQQADFGCRMRRMELWHSRN